MKSSSFINNAVSSLFLTEIYANIKNSNFTGSNGSEIIIKGSKLASIGNNFFNNS